MVIDCITYNGEADLFDLRYNILKDYVDEFIVVEFDKTFSGKKKKQQFPEFLDFGDPRKPIKHFFIEEEQYIKYKELAESSPNTIGAEHWKREFMQKESIKDCLTHLKDDDIVIVGDCDEIVSGIPPEDTVLKAKLKVYTYYLNNHSNEEFWGPIIAPYKLIKNAYLNHLRSTEHIKMQDYSGWHFTSMAKSLKQKLEDSYTDEDYANPLVMNNILNNILLDRDFLGRNFTFKVDESQWPQYLKDNRDKYLHLLK